MPRLYLLMACLAGCTAGNPNFGAMQQNDGGMTIAAPDLAAPPCRPDRLDSDPRHCGGCDNDCAILPNVDSSKVGCFAGACSLSGACLPGFADCSTGPGCETNLTVPASCGACGRACSTAQPVCALGSDGKYACSDRCPSSAPLLCDGSCVDPSSTVLHCGSCAPCPTMAGGAATCVAGQCGVVCASGLHKCGNGCVSNTSVASCGASCTPCSPPAGAPATCDGSKCDFTCNQGLVRDGNMCVGPTCSPSCGTSETCKNGGCCLNTGEFCNVPGDCCSGVCQSNTFYNTCRCKLKGADCGHGSECCSGSCVAGKCGCGHVGDACNTNGDCCYGTCFTLFSSSCECAAIDAACGENSDCCSGNCVGGFCKCKQTGSCSSDSHCCSGQCVDGMCRDCIKNGAACGATPCCSGTCGGSTCACGSSNAFCQDKSDCCDGFECISSKCTSCAFGYQSCAVKPCCPGLGLVCSSSTDTCCVPYGASCANSTSCCGGYACLSTKTCG